MDAQQDGLRWREQWMKSLARDGIRWNWDEEELRIRVKKDIDTALKKGRDFSDTTCGTIFDEGVLGGHPKVRRSLGRLMNLRDELYRKHRDLMIFLFHSPYHALDPILRKHRNPKLRHLVASLKIYLAHLQWLAAKKAAAAEDAARSPTATVPAPGALGPSTPQGQGTFIFTVQLFNEGARRHPRRAARRG